MATAATATHNGNGNGRATAADDGMMLTLEKCVQGSTPLVSPCASRQMR